MYAATVWCCCVNMGQTLSQMFWESGWMYGCFFSDTIKIWHKFISCKLLHCFRCVLICLAEQLEFFILFSVSVLSRKNNKTKFLYLCVVVRGTDLQEHLVLIYMELRKGRLSYITNAWGVQKRQTPHAPYVHKEQGQFSRQLVKGWVQIKRLGGENRQ